MVACFAVRGWEYATCRGRLPLAVHVRKDCCRVAVAGGRACRDGGLNAGQVLAREVDLDGAKRLRKRFAPARPNQRNDIRSAREHPEDRDLCD